MSHERATLAHVPLSRNIPVGPFSAQAPMSLRLKEESGRSLGSTVPSSPISLPRPSPMEHSKVAGAPSLGVTLTTIGDGRDSGKNRALFATIFIVRRTGVVKHESC